MSKKYVQIEERIQQTANAITEILNKKNWSGKRDGSVIKCSN